MEGGIERQVMGCAGKGVETEREGGRRGMGKELLGMIEKKMKYKMNGCVRKKILVVERIKFES